MVDISVKSGAAWEVSARERHLGDVLLSVHMGDEEDEVNKAKLCQAKGGETDRCDPVLLQKTQEDSPCVLTLSCSLGSSNLIGRLLVVSEARTAEVYNQSGDYCGTARGQRDNSVHTDSEDRGPFYRKELNLDQPCAGCEVKLLSLGGRNSVMVGRIVVGLRQLQPSPPRGPGIDMQAVQFLVEEIGTSLSPGAQDLMDMVHIQQKNQNSSLAGFLPLLMSSGALSAFSPAAARNQSQSAESSPPLEFSPADEMLSTDNAAMSRSSTSSPSSSPGSVTLSDLNTDNTDNSRHINHTHLAEIMSHFLKSDQRHTLSSNVELLPILQNICGQVTQLRLDNAAATVERGETMRNGSWELDTAMERRLEEMERRLKDHMDRRLDALEQKLERALMSALPLLTTNGVGIAPTAQIPASDVANG
ncbi:ATPase PAAT [Cynoglossus semilaevis]|uniref:Chromosome 8 C10orf88 homolog n=1 Tax=Cynoglossus semilaevis TaxID=244447 RepID=A0A3P8UJI3_CYNSE|nr:uncharacterized protein C10orf88 homolog [Cynoglossus semilaevis]